MEMTEKLPKKIDPRTTEEYIQGMKSYAEKGTEKSCPYRAGVGQKPNERVNWLTGFYDARSADQLRHIWEKFGIDYNAKE